MKIPSLESFGFSFENTLKFFGIPNGEEI